MADTRTLKLALLADVQKFLGGMNDAQMGTKTLSSKVGQYSKAMAKSFALAGAAGVAFAAKIGLDGVQAASDLNEEVSKAEVIFGDVSNEIKAFAKTADTALGLTQTQALKAASTFATFGKAAGLTGVDLSLFSKDATKLAADLGSFYNTNADDAILAIGAAMRGESEPIRKYGVLLDDVTIKAKAQEMGLYSGTGALDAQAKSLATYQVILDQTKDAQGDFARTSDGLAGQQKILNAQFQNLKTTIGESLLPAFKEVVTQANFVSNALGGKDAEGLSERARELAGTYDGQGSGAYNLGLALRNVATAFGLIFEALTSDEAGESTSSLQTFADALNAVAKGINAVATAYSTAKEALSYLGPRGTFEGFGGAKGLPNPLTLKPKSNAAGGPVMSGQPVRVGEFGPEIFYPSGTSGSIRKDSGGGGTTIIMNGIIDAESARRSIEKLLQNSARRTGPINLVGATL